MGLTAASMSSSCTSDHGIAPHVPAVRAAQRPIGQMVEQLRQIEAAG